MYVGHNWDIFTVDRTLIFPRGSELICCWHGYETPVVDIPLVFIPSARG